MLKKKNGVLLLIVTLVFVLSMLMTACQETKTDKTDNETPVEEHEHVWVRTGGTSGGTCQVQGYVEYICETCGETKRESTGQYAAHRWINHSCDYCGAREPGTETWNIGGCVANLYELSVIEPIPYLVLIDGSGSTGDFQENNRPWEKYIGAIKRVQISDNVSVLGANAFTGATVLENVTVTSPLQSIGDRAFEGCVVLSEVSLGTSLKKIGTAAFRNCESIRILDLSENSTDISPGALEGCVNLRNLTLASCHTTGTEPANRFFGSIFGEGNGKQTFLLEGVNYSFNVPDNLSILKLVGGDPIPDYAFYYCSSINTLTIGGTISRVGKYAFSQMENLRRLIFENDDLTDIGENAFSSCSVLGEESTDRETGEIIPNPVTLPAGLETLGKMAFNGCSNLSNIIFSGEGVTEIAASTFAYCPKLASITLPDSLVTIQREAFFDAGLEQIKIGANVQTIGEDAFARCTKLATIYVDSENVYAGSADASKLFKNAKHIYVLTKVTGKLSTGTKKWGMELKGEVKEIGYYLWE